MDHGLTQAPTMRIDGQRMGMSQLGLELPQDAHCCFIRPSDRRLPIGSGPNDITDEDKLSCNSARVQSRRDRGWPFRSSGASRLDCKKSSSTSVNPIARANQSVHCAGPVHSTGPALGSRRSSAVRDVGWAC